MSDSDISSNDGDWERDYDEELSIAFTEDELTSVEQRLEKCHHQLEEEREKTRRLEREIGILKRNGQEIKEQYDYEIELLTVMFKKERIQLRDQIVNLTERVIIEESKAAKEAPETNIFQDRENEGSEELMKTWMTIAIRKMKTTHAEIEEMAHQIFKIVSEKEKEAKQEVDPSYRKLMMKLVEKLEKKSKSFTDRMESMNAEVVQHAKAVITSAEKSSLRLDDKITMKEKNRRSKPKEITSGVVEFCDDLVRAEIYEAEGEKSTYKNLRVVNVRIEKMEEDNFYKETLTFMDGNTIEYTWKPDSLVRKGIRADVENDCLYIYSARHTLIRYYTRNPFKIRICPWVAVMRA